LLANKLGYSSLQALEAMFGLEELKKTRYFQEVAAEEREKGKLEAVTRLLKLGLTVEQIAEALELNVEMAREAASVLSRIF
jgi:predicted transposase YdaD